MRRSRRLKACMQSEQHSDCGVCAIANLFECSWRDAARRIFGSWSARKRQWGTTTKQIIGCINMYYGLIRVKRWEDIPDRSIVKVIPSACEGTSNWHWVCWRDGLVWDGLHSVPLRPERYNHRLVSYIGDKRK